MYIAAQQSNKFINFHNLWKFELESLIASRKFKKRATFVAISAVVFILFGLETFYATQAQAANGIRKTINFQGKLVNPNGTNVADGTYEIEFNIYTAASGGSPVWTETYDGGDEVTVTAGIFQVELGSLTTLPGSVNFNTDNIYLGITVEADSEMSPRIRFTSVPQAFNTEKVNGLTVTNTSDNPFSSATTLKIADGKTVVVNNGLTFSGTDTTTFTFPSTGGNIVTEDFAQTLTNKTIGAGGLVFTGATTDITTSSNQDFTITPNGTGKIGINTTTPLASLDVRANGAAGGTLAVASISGNTSLAALIVDNGGVGDIFGASTSGVAKFAVKNNGQLYVSNYTNDGGIFYTTTTGIIAQTAGGSNGDCLTFTGGLPAWGECSTAGDGTSNWVLSSGNGTLSPINNTLDLLWGGTSSQSAKFSVLNTAGDLTPVASVSAITGANATKGMSIAGDGTLQTVRNNTLTIGGGTTGNITLNPLNGTGFVNIAGTAGIVFGTDANNVNLYDGGSNVLATDDSLLVNGTYAAVGGGELYLGTDDTTAALAVLYGPSTGTNEGGELRIHLAADADTTFQSWNIDVFQDDLRFFRSDAAVTNTFTAEGQLLLPVTGSSGGIVIGGDVVLYDGGTNILRTDDNFNVNGLANISTAGVISGLTGVTLDSGAITLGGSTGTGLCLTGGTNASWGSCGSGGSSNWVLSSGNGTLSPINNTLDFLWGGTSTDSANFRVNGKNALSGTQVAASVSANTSYAGLVVDNRGVGDILAASSSGLTRFVVKQSGTVIIGNSTDGLTFDYLNGGPLYAGAARPTKKLTFSPEYPGAVLTASGSATTTGSMTSDASHSAEFRTFYEFVSTQTALQDYTVAVRVTLPKDFSSWASGNTMTFNFNTADNTNTANKLDIYMYLAGDTSGNPIYHSTANISATDKTWTTVNLTSGQLDNNHSTDWDDADETVIIYLKMYATGTYNYTQIGDIVLNYMSKF